jgi:D-alanyl-D-alanine carboxypeptidase/D-alanyl-D-alanine-endopeptidase (penicillin-binding protein 4)
MLKESDNLYADSLTKLLGFSLTKQGTYKQGVFAIKKLIAKNTNMDTDNIDLYDGHGTRYNLITPEQMVVLLTDIYKSKIMRPLIIDSLPLMGKSGSLANRMKNTKLENQVYAKTGSMHDISSLSGYFITKSGKPMAFSIIINGIDKNLSTAKGLEEKILSVVSKYN